jgi:hypothetical protein
MSSSIAPEASGDDIFNARAAAIAPRLQMLGGTLKSGSLSV